MCVPLAFVTDNLSRGLYYLRRLSVYLRPTNPERVGQHVRQRVGYVDDDLRGACPLYGTLHRRYTWGASR